MSTAIIKSICLLILSGSICLSQENPVSVQVFPDQRIFPRLTADGREHQFSLSAITKNSEWIGAVGASIPLVQVTALGVPFQAGVAATMFNRLVKTPGHLTVITVDYKVDFPIDVRLSDLSLRTGLGHMSCHFADDALELYGKRSIQHVNDYVILGAAYDIRTILGYVYFQVHYSYGTQPVPDRPWLIQVGMDVANIPLGPVLTLYGAVDIKVKQEVGWGSTQSFQAGVKAFPDRRVSLRLAYTHRRGFDERGQFYLTKDTMHLISAFLDF